MTKKWAKLYMLVVLLGLTACSNSKPIMGKYESMDHTMITINEDGTIHYHFIKGRWKKMSNHQILAEFGKAYEPLIITQTKNINMIQVESTDPRWSTSLYRLIEQ